MKCLHVGHLSASQFRLMFSLQQSEYLISHWLILSQGIVNSKFFPPPCWVRLDLPVQAECGQPM